MCISILSELIQPYFSGRSYMIYKTKIDFKNRASGVGNIYGHIGQKLNSLQQFTIFRKESYLEHVR